MPNEPVTEEGPVARGDPLHQILFDLLGMCVCAESQSQGKAGHMGIDHDSGFDPKGISQHHVGGLASHAIQREQGIHRLRNLSPVLFHQDATAGLDVAGLVAEEPNAADVEGQCIEIGQGVVLGAPVFLEQGTR